MIDALGYAASTAVLATFLMRTMFPLRVIAIVSNVLFIVYGHLTHIPPVMLLHIALLPINIVRLSALWREGECDYGLARHHSSVTHRSAGLKRQSEESAA